MNWIKQNFNWYFPIITSIIGVLVGKFWDAMFKINEHKTKKKDTCFAENARLKEEIRKLTDQREKIGKFTYSSSGFYFLKDDKSEQRICSRCFDSEGKIINLVVSKSNHFSCPNCSNAGWLQDEQEIQDEQDAQITEFLRYGK